MSIAATPVNRGPLRTLGLFALGVLLVVLAILALRHWAGDAKPPARQTAKVVLLPDTPPPPPPPPPKDKPDTPPPQAKAAPQAVPDAPKAPPAPAPLKMEGAAGTGPSAFGSGTVSQDYKGGPVAIGGAGSGAASAPTDRAQERLYASSIKSLLQAEIERQLAADAGELTAAFAIWIDPDGRIARWQFDDAPSRPAARNDMQAALDKSAQRLTLPPPPGVAQPLRFRLTVRAGS